MPKGVNIPHYVIEGDRICFISGCVKSVALLSSAIGRQMLEYAIFLGDIDKEQV